MLKVENVTKYYGTNCAVNNLSFTVKNGEISITVNKKGQVRIQKFIEQY